MTLNNNCSKKAKIIKLIIFDVDGVLTDGSLYFADDGTEFKRFSALDGMGIKMLQDCGIETAVITSRNSKSVAHRLKDLGIKHFYSGQTDKKTAFAELLKKCKLNANQVAYMGDDVVDLAVMQAAGFAIAPDNAHFLVKQTADMVCKKTGGFGAVRELCDFLLQSQDKFNTAISHYVKTRPLIKMTKFQQQCYAALKQVPAGKVISYGGLARLMQHPNACQAVGGAMSKNPFAPEVPCHRVVKSNGELGGFTDNIKVKIKRLADEGVQVKHGKIVDFADKLFSKHKL